MNELKSSKVQTAKLKTMKDLKRLLKLKSFEFSPPQRSREEQTIRERWGQKDGRGQCEDRDRAEEKKQQISLKRNSKRQKGEEKEVFFKFKKWKSSKKCEFIPLLVFWWMFRCFCFRGNLAKLDSSLHILHILQKKWFQNESLRGVPCLY